MFLFNIIYIIIISIRFIFLYKLTEILHEGNYIPILVNIKKILKITS